jgi:hypothetical protein
MIYSTIKIEERSADGLLEPREYLLAYSNMLLANVCTKMIQKELMCIVLGEAGHLPLVRQ